MKLNLAWDGNLLIKTWPLPWLLIDVHMARGERIIKEGKEKLDVKQNAFVSCCYIQGFNSSFCFNLNPNNA